MSLKLSSVSPLPFTNTEDPDYHSLASLTYQDKEEGKIVQVPKGDVFHQFRQDVDADRLPTVSWLVAPCRFSDHPGSPWFGAWYVSETLGILTKNPEIWKKTIFILTYHWLLSHFIDGTH